MEKVNYFGKDGLLPSSGGELTTDRKGLVTGRMVYKVKPGRWAQMPQLNSAHPYASFCTMEKRQVRFDPGFWSVLCDYAGCEQDETEPVEDFNPGVGGEPIEITANFVSEIAGKPSAPLNGAIFLDEGGQLTEDDSKGVFDRFRVLNDEGELNPWAGTENYLTMNNGIYTRSWVSKRKPSGIAGSEVPLKIVNKPPGRSPSFGGAYNWLEFPPGYSLRGGAYDLRQSWLLSGPRGFNQVIYSQ